MKLIVIANPDPVQQEFEILEKLFDAGLEYFHLRKPSFPFAEAERYVSNIPEAYRDRVVLHEHYELAGAYGLKGIHQTSKNRDAWEIARKQHPELQRSASVHTVEELQQVSDVEFAYVFFSPVFPSLSKMGYEPRYSQSELKGIFASTSHRIVALGGIEENKIETLLRWGCFGAAALGSIWNSNTPVETFTRLKAKCEQVVHSF